MFGWVYTIASSSVMSIGEQLAVFQAQDNEKNSGLRDK